VSEKTAHSQASRQYGCIGDGFGTGSPLTGICGQGMSNVFAAPPIKYF